MGKQGNRLPIYLRCSLENGRSTGSTDSRPSSRMDGANGSPIYLRCSLENGRSTAKMGHRSDSRHTLLAALPIANAPHATKNGLMSLCRSEEHTSELQSRQ